MTVDLFHCYSMFYTGSPFPSEIMVGSEACQIPQPFYNEKVGKIAPRGVSAS